MNGIGPQRYASASRGGAELDEQRRGETAGVVEVAAFDVVGARAAVADDGVHVRERCEERAGFGGEGVVAAAARAVQPPDLPLGVLLRERVEHGERWSGADARAHEQHGGLGAVEDEGAARRRDLELVADAEAGVQIAAGGSVGFALDGDPVVAGVRLTREGVVSEQRPLCGVGLDADRQVLAGPGRRKRCASGVVEPDGDHGVALAVDLGDRQLAEPWPGRRRARDREAGIAAAGPSLEQGAKRRLPAGAERRDPQRSEELLARVSGQVEERVGLGDGHLLRT